MVSLSQILNSVLFLHFLACSIVYRHVWLGISVRFAAFTTKASIITGEEYVRPPARQQPSRVLSIAHRPRISSINKEVAGAFCARHASRESDEKDLHSQIPELEVCITWNQTSVTDLLYRILGSLQCFKININCLMINNRERHLYFELWMNKK